MNDVRQTESKTLLAWFEECIFLQRNATPDNAMRFMAIRSGIMKHLQIEFAAFYNWLYRVQKYKPQVNPRPTHQTQKHAAMTTTNSSGA